MYKHNRGVSLNNRTGGFFSAKTKAEIAADLASYNAFLEREAWRLIQPFHSWMRTPHGREWLNLQAQRAQAHQQELDERREALAQAQSRAERLAAVMDAEGIAPRKPT